ncbi:hypothetical protein CEE37_03405 [candidate division LCP-89 bacterium B3_LCP]|uniref:FlgD/Vpr Ig-like domain-containing protein n=1 Tax=candidate division LCP-89 bacterium B3_LCP TaxID=2012998 RepID=A0A532V336_UNCL8|nr:MAG: hypothetical protein CEE37_03405 [candidate division LCP-89 bacterium B3_LCP]
MQTMQKLVCGFIVLSLLVLPVSAQEIYNVKVISAGTDWFKVIMMEIGAEDIIDGSSVELVSTLLPIHNFTLNTDFFANGGELSYSRVPFGPSSVQVNFDVTVDYELKLACMKGSLGVLTIQIWQNNILLEEYVNDLSGDWCFSNWNFFPASGLESLVDPVPNDNSLQQNYPNPFNPATSIAYSVQQAGNVKINIYNSLGQRIATLVNQQQNPGEYSIEWDGKTYSGSDAAAGVYYYELVVDDYRSARQMIMLK